MEFDESAMAPTYRLLWGIPGRSNALNIAQRLGLDTSVVDDARGRLGAAEVKSRLAIAYQLQEVPYVRRASRSEWQLHRVLIDRTRLFACLFAFCHMLTGFVETGSMLGVM